MELIYIALILASAFFHAFYNFLMHKSGGSRLFLLLLFSIASICAGITYIISDTKISLSPMAFILLYGASVFYVLYQISVTKSYEHGEISKLYPLTVISPIFIPIWASIFLNEKLNFGIAIGILTTIFGAISIKQKSFKISELKHLFSTKGSYKGAGFAILASFMFSIGSVLDKSGIGNFELTPYLWILLSCMACNMLLYSLIFERKVFKEISKIKTIPVILAGIAGFISFFSFRAALQHVDITIAVPIRISSVFFALLLGTIFLHEKITKNKIIGISILIIGILTINFSVN